MHALRVLHQNKHHSTPPERLGNSAESLSDGSLPTVWRLPLGTSGDKTVMQNWPWMWLEVGVFGQTASEHRSRVSTDNGTATTATRTKVQFSNVGSTWKNLMQPAARYVALFPSFFFQCKVTICRLIKRPTSQICTLFCSVLFKKKKLKKKQKRAWTFLNNTGSQLCFTWFFFLTTEETRYSRSPFGTHLVVEVGENGRDGLKDVDGGHGVLVLLVPVVQQRHLLGHVLGTLPQQLELCGQDERRDGTVAILLTQEHLHTQWTHCSHYLLLTQEHLHTRWAND